MVEKSSEIRWGALKAWCGIYYVIIGSQTLQGPLPTAPQCPGAPHYLRGRLCPVWEVTISGKPRTPPVPAAVSSRGRGSAPGRTHLQYGRGSRPGPWGLLKGPASALRGSCEERGGWGQDLDTKEGKQSRPLCAGPPLALGPISSFPAPGHLVTIQ